MILLNEGKHDVTIGYVKKRKHPYRTIVPLWVLSSRNYIWSYCLFFVYYNHNYVTQNFSFWCYDLAVYLHTHHTHTHHTHTHRALETLVKVSLTPSCSACLHLVSGTTSSRAAVAERPSSSSTGPSQAKTSVASAQTPTRGPRTVECTTTIRPHATEDPLKGHPW